MYPLKGWVHSSDPDVLVINETWFKKSVLNTDVNLSGYNLFQQDRSSKGGGVAIFTKDHLQCSVVSTKSLPNNLIENKREPHTLGAQMQNFYFQRFVSQAVFIRVFSSFLLL